jgi:hypothetical protein
MTDATLTKTRIRAGVWEGILSGPTTVPTLQVTLLEQILPGVQVQPLPGRPAMWMVKVPIPAEALSDGVQTFLIRDAARGETLAHFTIVTGVAMEDDLRAEIDLLRAELDMLKRAFRRHCLETA